MLEHSELAEQAAQTARVPPPVLPEPLLPAAVLALPLLVPLPLVPIPDEADAVAVVAAVLEAWLVVAPEPEPEELELVAPPKVQALRLASAA